MPTEKQNESTPSAVIHTVNIPLATLHEITDICQLIAQFCDLTTLMNLRRTNRSFKKTVTESLTYKNPNGKLELATEIISRTFFSLPSNVSFQLPSTNPKLQQGDITTTGFILKILQLLNQHEQNLKIGWLRTHTISPLFYKRNKVNFEQVRLERASLLGEGGTDLFPRDEILKTLATNPDVFKCNGMSFSAYIAAFENHRSRMVRYRTLSFLISSMLITIVIASSVFLMIRYKERYPVQAGFDCSIEENRATYAGPSKFTCQHIISCDGGITNITTANITAAIMAVCNMLCPTTKDSFLKNILNTTAAGFCPSDISSIGKLFMVLGALGLLTILSKNGLVVRRNRQLNEELLEKWVPKEEPSSADTTENQERTSSLTTEMGKCFQHATARCLNGIFSLFKKSPHGPTETTSLLTPFVVNVDKRNERNESMGC